jgi:hypothetical protein
MHMKRFFQLSSIGFAITLAPFIASAHEHQTFRIGDKEYDFTIGSLNEPVTVDDKAGVELNIWEAASGSFAGGPVTGLEETLKVEVQADGRKKIMDLTPAWGEEGSYHAVFFPTVATEYSYRLIGTINDIPVDLTFTCHGGGHVMHGGEEDNAEVEITENITRIHRTGSFSCPKEKEALGFPAEAASLDSLNDSASMGAMLGLAGLIAGLAGLTAGITALMRSRKPLS